MPDFVVAFPGLTYEAFQKHSTSRSRYGKIIELANDMNVSAAYIPAQRTAFITFWGAKGGSVVIPCTGDDSEAEAEGKRSADVEVTSASGLVLILEMNPRERWVLRFADPTQKLHGTVDITFRLVGEGEPLEG